MTTNTTTTTGGWVRGPAFDGLFMLSGLWLAPIALYYGAGDAAPSTTPLDDVYLILTALFWIGHRVASAYVAYCTTAYRPLLRSQRTRFVLVPLLLIGAVTLFLVPEGVWPFPRSQRVTALIAIDFVLITYHFAAQHYGVLSLYRLRAGHERSPKAKRVDRAFALGVGGALVFSIDAAAGLDFFGDLFGDAAGLELLRASWDELRWVGTALAIAGTAAVLGWDATRSGIAIPRTLYLLSVTLVVVCGFWVPPYTFVVLWTVQHWTAAMGLSTILAGHGPAPGSSPWYRVFSFVNRREWLVLLLLATASTVLLPVMEVEAVAEGGDRYGGRILPWLAEAVSASELGPPLVALGFVTAFLHYQLDRAVFRLSDADVRQAAAGLLGATSSRP